MKTLYFLIKVDSEGGVHFERSFKDKIKSILGLPFIEKVFIYDKNGLKKVYITENNKDETFILNEIEGVLANLYTIKKYDEFVKYLMNNTEIIAKEGNIFLVYDPILKDKKFVKVSRFFNKIINIEVF
jgi:hypothetical protein